MANEKKVVVKGGGKNLYKISESNGWHYVYKIEVGLMSSGKSEIGKTRSMPDALDLIRSYSGREIQEIS